jgi:hypothetical protein
MVGIVDRIHEIRCKMITDTVKPIGRPVHRHAAAQPIIL